MIIQKNHLAIAMSLAGVVGLGASAVHAVDFTASATVENTVTVVNIQDFDLGTIFASRSSASVSDGVAALVIAAADGSVTDPTDSADVDIISLSTPIPGQGSVDVAGDFDLVFPATDAIDPADFATDATAGTLGLVLTDPGVTQLENQAAIGNPAIPSLYLLHFTVGDVSGGTTGTETATFDGSFPISMGFGETTYVFNIGGTVVTEPGTNIDYEPGTYSGTFEVTASY